MKKRLIGSLCIALVFVFIISGIATANPAQNKTTISTEEFSQVKANMIKDGVIDEVTQDKLIAKLQNGETLDCMDPVKVSEASKNLIATKDNPKAVYYFDDGSYIYLGVTVVEATDLDSVESDLETSSEEWNYTATASCGNSLGEASFHGYVNIRDPGYDDIEGLGARDIYFKKYMSTETGYSITRLGRAQR